jgi:hypothetical protein
MAVKRTVRVDRSVLEITRAELESGAATVSFRVTVAGAQGNFAIADTLGRCVLRDGDAPEPREIYERFWPGSPGDIPEEDDQTYTLAVAFVSAVKYSYLVRLCGRDGTLRSVIKDIDFSSTNPDDSDFSAFRMMLL